MHDQKKNSLASVHGLEAKEMGVEATKKRATAYRILDKILIVLKEFQYSQFVNYFHLFMII